MIGAILLALGSSCLFLVIALDTFSEKFEHTFMRGLSHRISSSPTFNLVSYEGTIPFFLLGLHLLIEKTQNPMLLDGYPDLWSRIVTWLPLVFGFALEYGAFRTIWNGSKE